MMYTMTGDVVELPVGGVVRKKNNPSSRQAEMSRLQQLADLLGMTQVREGGASRERPGGGRGMQGWPLPYSMKPSSHATADLGAAAFGAAGAFTAFGAAALAGAFLAGAVFAGALGVVAMVSDSLG